MSPLISVVVPVYNVAQYLDQCLESIVNQTYRNLEILVVDDGSTDGSGAMCDRWTERDERIHVFHQPNGGLSAARNTALDNMKGEIVTMVDSDDLIHPDFISTLLRLMQQHEADIAVAGYQPFYDREAHLPPLESPYKVQQYGRHEALMSIFYQQGLTHSAWGRLYEASLFDGIRYPIGQNYEDLAIIYPLILKCGRVAKINYTLYGYRQRKSSILGAFSPKRADVLDICEDLEQTMELHDPKYLNAVRSRLLSAYFNILLLSSQDKEGDHQQLQDRCWRGIKRLRWGCLKDKNVRRKNKYGIIASLLGCNFLCNMVGRNYQPRP